MARYDSYMSKFLYYLNLVAHGQSSILLFRRLWDRVSASGRHMAQCLGCLLFSNQLQYTGLDIARTLNDCYYHLLPWTKLEKKLPNLNLKKWAYMVTNGNNEFDSTISMATNIGMFGLCHFQPTFNHVKTKRHISKFQG